MSSNDEAEKPALSIMMTEPGEFANFLHRSGLLLLLMSLYDASYGGGVRNPEFVGLLGMFLIIIALSGYLSFVHWAVVELADKIVIMTGGRATDE